jgi:anti-sigma regulatory factor (Ser/Thr protein kinase)
VALVMAADALMGLALYRDRGSTAGAWASVVASPWATAYFVAWEALTNAVKHASPTRVVVETAHEGGVLRMSIVDDGVGTPRPVSALDDLSPREKEVLELMAEGRTNAGIPEATAGDTLDIYAVDYVGTHKRHAKRATGSEHVRCTLTAPRPSRPASRTSRSAGRC